MDWGQAVYLGVYRVQALIGAGGMGEVYRARDTKLGRTSRSRSCRAAFTADPERLARFEREARMLAALNHPQHRRHPRPRRARRRSCLVLELVDASWSRGRTLAERDRGHGPCPR